MKSNHAPLPFYFGSADKPLFGCYHDSRPGRARKCAVVICQPMGHEYINCHRALRQLAVRFSEADFPVLRFDYYGCGDSSGNAEEGTIAQWLDDLSRAISEVRQRTRALQVCVVGLRLGGALALMLGAQKQDLDSLVLWDPVVKGKNYLDELFSLRKEMLRFRPRSRRSPESQDYTDLLGFPLSKALSLDLQQINLLHIAQRPARNVLFIETEQANSEGQLRDHLSRNEARLDYQFLDAPQIWLPTANGSLLVPSALLQSIVRWSCRIH